MAKTNMTPRDIYEKSGVSYRAMDPVKKSAQKLAKSTAKNLLRLKEKEVPESRGESSYVYDCGDHYRAFVIEGLGTKNIVEDEMIKITGKSYYSVISQDTVAMIVNDLITVGAKPEVINAYFAVGHSSWFSDKKRVRELLLGWKRACNLAGATWGGGETPTLTNIVHKNTIELAGAATGVIRPKSRLVLGEKLGAGDLIILLESSGIHANGLTLARRIAKKLPQGLATPMPSGKMFGEALRRPTIIYAKFIDELFDQKVDIHYMVNITGHGWRKIMRHPKKLSYVIEMIPTPQEEFTFMQEQGQISEKDMYGNFNMGAGFGIFINPKDLNKVETAAKSQKLKIYNAGYVKKGPREVQILPKNLTFKSESLDLR
ncbi:MAG: AIR synthase-related protein [Candidatus Curtissbacteria bacterium]|nr:AIR synthase-related protein [Candidatus Curtissbacteria bacterium]